MYVFGGPFIVGVHVQVVPLRDYEAGRVEAFVRYRQPDRGLLPDRVLGTTGEERPYYELVHTTLHVDQI